MRSNHGYKIYSRLFCDANSSLRMLHMKQPELSERHVQHFFFVENHFATSLKKLSHWLHLNCIVWTTKSRNLFCLCLEVTEHLPWSENCYTSGSNVIQLFSSDVKEYHTAR